MSGYHAWNWKALHAYAQEGEGVFHRHPCMT